MTFSYMSGLLVFGIMVSMAYADGPDYHDTDDAGNDATVIVHSRGRAVQITGEPGIEILKLCEEMLAGANDRLLVLLTKTRVDSITSKERAVEVAYAVPRSLKGKLPFGGLRRIVIPLSGEMSKGRLIFESEGESGIRTYGVAVNPSAEERLKQAVQRLKVD